MAVQSPGSRSGHGGDLSLALTDLVERIVISGVSLTTRAVAEASLGFDLSFPQWRVMVVLGDRQDGVRISEVATRIGVTVPATSRQLKRLVKRGLVRVGPDLLDRRAVRAELTPLGWDVRRAVRAHRRGRIADSTQGLGAQATVHEVEKIAAALDRYR